jgi:hypothetical protein
VFQFVVKTAFILLFGWSAVAGADGAFQPRSSFSGDWVLASVKPERPGYDNFWLGTEATVTQSADRVVIVRVNPPPRREARFRLDGSESRNDYVVNGQRLIRGSRATLSRGLLLISTDTTDAEGRRWLSNISRWSLDADGTLVVSDTEICGRGECPSVITTLRLTRK